jgi:hypothetical protein
MSKRSFEMFQYRQVLLRMRQGDSDREIAHSGLMGRTKAGAVRAVAQARVRGRLDAAAVLRWLDFAVQPLGGANRVLRYDSFAFRLALSLTAWSVAGERVGIVPS